MESINVNENQNNETVDTGALEERTYTEAEVLALIQKEADKRVTQALKTAESKFEKKFTEAEKLRSMDEKQKLQYQNDQLTARIAEMEKASILAENTKTATSIMAEKGLPVQFVSYVVADDAETMSENIDNFDRAFKAAVADEVAKRISAGGSPKGGVSTKQTGLNSTKGLSLAERQNLKKTNPSLYNTIKFHA